MSHATDAVAAILARLAPQSPQNPGKPLKAKDRKPGTSAGTGEIARVRRVVYPTTDPKAPLRPFNGALSPTRSGATQTQTRSKRLDTETPQDVAAALSSIPNPLDYALVLWVGTDWRFDLRGLHAALRELTTGEAIHRHWEKIARVEPDPSRPGQRMLWTNHDLLQRLIPAVLDELAAADACGTCHATGKVLDQHAKPKPAWVTCRFCLGTGRVRVGLERRAKLLRMRKSDYKTSHARHAYDWLLSECNGRVAQAAQDLKRARRGEDE